MCYASHDLRIQNSQSKHKNKFAFVICYTCCRNFDGSVSLTQQFSDGSNSVTASQSNAVDSPANGKPAVAGKSPTTSNNKRDGDGVSAVELQKERADVVRMMRSKLDNNCGIVDIMLAYLSQLALHTNIKWSVLVTCIV